MAGNAVAGHSSGVLQELSPDKYMPDHILCLSGGQEHSTPSTARTGLAGLMIGNRSALCGVGVHVKENCRIIQ